MTDEPDIETSLADLERTQKRAHRTYRRATLLSAWSLIVLATIDTGFVLLGGGVWVPRDLTAVGGLTVMGMLGYVGAARAYRALVERDADLIDSFRKRAELEKALREVRDEIAPLMEAISSARARGAALVIHPFEPYGLPPTEPPKSVH